VNGFAGDASALWAVAAKAALIHLTALAALRVAERRTIAQWTIIDFATAFSVPDPVDRR
jgi:uncharacterized membrane protein YcaP (DUF421 family)